MKLKKIGGRIQAELKPFFNFKVENWQDVMALIFGGFIFFILLFQAFFFDMTYDEAYTYMNTGRYDNVWQIYQFRIANTHFLNSLLMSLTTIFFPFNDVAIRLPAILFGGFYVATAISFSKKYQNRLIALGLFFTFYFFTMYLSWARGYGMSAACVLAMVFVYSNKSRFANWFITFSVFGLLAMYGNYVAIPIILVFGAYVFVVDLKFKFPEIPKKTWYWLIGFFLLGVYGFYSVTKVGKPLYGAFNETFIEAVPMDWIARFVGGYATSGYEISENLLVLTDLSGPLFLMFAISVIVVYFWGGKKNPIGLITLTTLFLIFVISTIGSKPLPTGRVLLPYWPLMVIAVLEILEFGTDKMKLNKTSLSMINGFVLVALVFNYSGHLNRLFIQEIQSDKDYYALKLLKEYSLDYSPVDVYYDFTVGENGTRETRPEDVYYVEKERREKKIIKRLTTKTPQTEMEVGNFAVRVYTEEKLVTLYFNSPPKSQHFNRILLLKGDTVFANKFDIKAELFEEGYDLPLLLPFPTDVLCDELVLKSDDGTVNLAIPIPTS